MTCIAHVPLRTKGAHKSQLSDHCWQMHQQNIQSYYIAFCKHWLKCLLRELSKYSYRMTLESKYDFFLRDSNMPYKRGAIKVGLAPPFKSTKYTITRPMRWQFICHLGPPSLLITLNHILSRTSFFTAAPHDDLRHLISKDFHRTCTHTQESTNISYYA